MNFSNLHYFQAVARHGNLSQAAKELYITQPGLSRYLSRLEDEIGVPLFERRKGRIELNTYGHILLGSVDLAFDQLKKGIETIHQLYSRDQNILSVACSIEDFLIDRLKDFSPLHPEIGIRQFSYSLAEIEAQLLRQNLDFAICAHPIQNDKIKYDQLSNCPWVLICNRDNPLAQESAVYLSQAKDEIFVCESARLNRKQLETLCHKSGFTPRISHEIENGYILTNLLEANTGVALAPLAFSVKLDSHFPHHHLKVLRLKDEDFPRAEIGIAYLGEKKQSSSAICFMEHLHKCAENEYVFLEALQNSQDL